jgi:hypothetical protein
MVQDILRSEVATLGHVIASRMRCFFNSDRAYSLRFGFIRKGHVHGEVIQV